MAAISVDQLHVFAMRRAVQLGVRMEELESGFVSGVYKEGPLRLIEYVLHEAAHLITLNYDLRKPPGVVHSLSDFIARKLSRKHPPSVRDSLEVKTSLITYLAGTALQLWSDPTSFISNCIRSTELESWSVATVTEFFENCQLQPYFTNRSQDLVFWLTYTGRHAEA